MRTSSAQGLYKGILFLLGFLLSPSIVYAAGSPGNIIGKLESSGRSAGTESVSDLGAVIGGVLGVGISFVGLFLTILVIYAGFLWMTARGDEEKVKKTQKILAGSIAGFIVVISAYAITVAAGTLLNRRTRSLDEGVPQGCCKVQDLNSSEDTYEFLTEDQCDNRDFEDDINTRFDESIQDEDECLAQNNAPTP